MKIFNLFAFLLHLCNLAECSANLSNTQREFDIHGRLIKERFVNGKSIELSYDEMNRVTDISLGEIGGITYRYEDAKLLQVSRISPSGHIMYTQSYKYNDIGELLHEDLISGLGQVSYEKDLNKKFVRIESPYSQEICKFNSKGFIATHILNDKSFEYCYDKDDQLVISEKDGTSPLLEYDDKGHLTNKISERRKYHFEFNIDGNLVEAITSECKVHYFYDDFGRRVAKKIEKNGKEEIETYLYFGNNEIAIFGGDGDLKQLRIPGLSFNDNFIMPISIETKDEIYAAIHDYKGNIFKLINTKDKEIIPIPVIDPFGQDLHTIDSLTPWLFASKHYDAETNLVYFGSRYYDPELSQWITPDPMGTLQHSNVYLYCLGNPVSYFDPDGKFAFAISLLNIAWGAGAIITLPAWGTAAVVTAAGAAVGWATYEIIQKAKEGNQRDGTPGWNGAQNDQFSDAVKSIERKTGKRLTDDQIEKLHDAISGMDYGYHEIVEEGYWLFK